MNSLERLRTSSCFAILFSNIFLPALLVGCAATRPPQSTELLLKNRDEYVKSYLEDSNERYTAVLQRNKAQLDEYKAGQRSAPPIIDYLIISGGGDYGAFGAGFLKGWSRVPKDNPLARPPRFDVATG